MVLVRLPKPISLCNLGCIDIVNSDIVLSAKVLLHLVRQVLGKIFAFPDGVQQERAVLTQTAGYVVHVQVSLNGKPRSWAYLPGM